MNGKIKVSAPRKNPHVCYIDQKYKDSIHLIKEKCGKSFYKVMCECAGCELDTVEHIKEFKQELKKKGYRNIGEWANQLVEYLTKNIESLHLLDLSLIELNKEE